ncbi:chromate transporter [Anaerocolumna sp. AGMB13025]|uniref:chromate transporter n=1 Tax=Anaerocolumna sp. AGMB13025 TaxID=3039116 RepID=UPI00241C2CF7|nr:chromate transporter [Anaerocolumna sp. AGMB13025]WFR55978.1 chromate transporter [Anaerocolumna sp. AGMB13025]
MKEKWNLYLKLFTSTFILSSITFGGGYVIVPLMKKKFVMDLKWISEEEMINLIAIAQSSPGAIAVNVSILMGYHMAGLIGVLFSLLGTVLPPFIILSALSSFYSAFCDNPYINALLKGLQAGIAAVLTDVILSMGSSIVKEKEVISILLMIAAFLITYFIKINVVITILACGMTGALLNITLRKIKGKEE